MKAQLLTALLSCLATVNVNANATDALLETSTTATSSDREEVQRALDWLAEQADERKARRHHYESVAESILARAQSHFASEVEYLIFANDTVSNLSRALDDLDKKVQRRTATREDYQHAVSVLTSRARSVFGSPVDSTSAAPSSELRRSLTWLSEQAEKRQASRGDYESVAAEIIGRAREHFGPSEVEFQVFATSLTETLRSQIGRLEEKVKERNATRKDFNEIVDMLMSRAREVNGI